MRRLVRDGAGALVINVGRAHGVWQVTRDGVFYGDYPVRESAMEAASAAARLPLTRTLRAAIVVSAWTADRRCGPRQR